MEYEASAQAQAEGSGLKQQAFKLGPGFKLQAFKLTSAQAASRKLPDRGAWIKFRASGVAGLDKDECIRGMLDMKRYLVWRK